MFSALRISVLREGLEKGMLEAAESILVISMTSFVSGLHHVATEVNADSFGPSGTERPRRGRPVESLQ